MAVFLHRNFKVFTIYDQNYNNIMIQEHNWECCQFSLTEIY